MREENEKAVSEAPGDMNKVLGIRHSMVSRGLESLDHTIEP